MTDIGEPVEITLQGEDPEGSTLSYRITVPPNRGQATIAGNILSYTPDTFGSQSIRVVTNDGELDSEPAEFTIRIREPNAAPAAKDLTVSTKEETAATVTLEGSDPEGQTLSFRVTANPRGGLLSGTPPALVYTPLADFTGNDVFYYVANDGALESQPAVVNITVTRENDAPVAWNATVTGGRNKPLPMVLHGTDPDNDPLQFIVVNQPASGTLTGTPPALTYTPNIDFAGNDQFRYKVNDGKLDSAEAIHGLHDSEKSILARNRKVERGLQHGEPDDNEIAPTFGLTRQQFGPRFPRD